MTILVRNLFFIFSKEEESSKPRKAFKFTNFSEEISSVDYSIVYQLAGAANLTQVFLQESINVL